MDSTEKKISAPLSPTPEDLKKSADGWWRTQSATIALLKHAYSQIGDAERRIAEQDKRIRELEDLAATDPLTGLMNRRGFEKFFELEQARIRRQHSPGALFILIDLDLFKPINDTYGHLAGDACLQMVSKKLLQSIRMLDGAARLGGDEFALLLTQLDPEKTSAYLDKFRHLLDSVSLEWQGKKIDFGASIGTALVTADSAYTDVYNGADASLYASKKDRKRAVQKA
jgi:diguanylate cyclase (GGDEF)-like protein